MYKSILFLAITFLVSNYSFSQEKKDIGWLIAPIQSFGGMSAAFEYRIPTKDQYKFKIGLVGSSDFQNNVYSPELITVNDSVVVQRFLHKSRSSVDFRVGGERRLKQSMFSIITDLNIGYMNEDVHYLFNNYVNDSAAWQYVEQNDFYLTSPRVKRHYLNTNIRLGASMDVPVGKYLLLNLFAAGNFGLPIPLAETKKIDPNNELSSAGYTFNFTPSVGIGLRYMLGVNKTE